MAKKPKVIYLGDPRAAIETENSELSSDEAIEAFVTEAVERAEVMAKQGADHVRQVLDEPNVRKMKKAWRDDAPMSDFFGSPPGKPKMNNVLDRLERAHRRLRDKQLKIRLKENKVSKPDTNGHNYGGDLSPRRFVLFDRWFGIDDLDQRAAIIVHELLHDRHIDHKVKDPDTGKRVTVYGEDLARELAARNPGKARRNPENYEQFCLTVA